MRMRTAGPGNLLPEAAYSFRLRLSAPIHTGVVTHLFDVNVISLRVTEAAERLAHIIYLYHAAHTNRLDLSWVPKHTVRTHGIRKRKNTETFYCVMIRAYSGTTVLF